MVVAGAAVEQVDACLAVQAIVVTVTEQAVGVGAAPEPVQARSAVQNVESRTAAQNVVAAEPSDGAWASTVTPWRSSDAWRSSSANDGRSVEKRPPPASSVRSPLIEPPRAVISSTSPRATRSRKSR